MSIRTSPTRLGIAPCISYVGVVGRRYIGMKVDTGVMLISGCCASASSTSFVHPTKVSAGEDSASAEDDALIEDENIFIFIRGEAMSSNDDVRDSVLYKRNYLAIDVSNLFSGSFIPGIF